MNVPVILALGAIVVFAVVIVMTRAKEPQERATALTRTGAAVMAVFTVVAGIFIVGYVMQDPGGNAGLIITLVWLVPMLILAVAAWFWPAATAPLLLALASAFIAACVWLAFDPTALRSFVSENGPIIAVSVVALAFPAAVLGLKRTALAGWLLVALGVLPLVITLIASSGPVGSLVAASVVPLVCGIAYLVSARMVIESTASGDHRAAAA
ncbi:hypothetical protein [Arthrobacter sp. ok362]|jgi:hypothetical protein|uniref:hypothetical protein n=1 Tax=Arthrobacter sp. ok362 TaxID=1761745 RepID=UPI0008865814|nr:hypothetical protein [Arthrobacter sp. ok362]SDK42996.1 hypothetical protein SAMN04487913_101202 [Arthrobacter sp. ok362]